MFQCDIFRTFKSEYCPLIVPHSPREALPKWITKAHASEHHFQAAEGERNQTQNLICSVDKTMILSMFYLIPLFRMPSISPSNAAILFRARSSVQMTRLAKFKVRKWIPTTSGIICQILSRRVTTSLFQTDFREGRGPDMGRHQVINYLTCYVYDGVTFVCMLQVAAGCDQDVSDAGHG